MRQAGYLAAAGIYALENHVQRMAQDHQRAKALEEALLASPDVESALPVETNIVIFKLREGLHAQDVVQKLKQQHVYANPASSRDIRFVTHLQFNDEGLEHTCKVIRDVLGSG